MNSSKPKNNIVLDFDGTLLDSRHRHAVVLSDCINIINKMKSTYHDFDDFVSYKSEVNTGLDYLHKKKIPNSEAISELWTKKIEDKKYLKTDVLYPNISKCLDIIKKQYNLFLITARANKKNAIWQISQLNIDTFFTEIFIVSNIGDVGYNKYMAIKSYPIFCVIGDMEADYDFAKRIRSFFFPMNCGFRSETYWKHCIGKSYKNIQEILSQILNNYEKK